MKAHALRNLATDWLCQTYPGLIIVNELSVANWGGAPIDVAAITECSRRPDRTPTQFRRGQGAKPLTKSALVAPFFSGV